MNQNANNIELDIGNDPGLSRDDYQTTLHEIRSGLTREQAEAANVEKKIAIIEADYFKSVKNLFGSSNYSKFEALKKSSRTTLISNAFQNNLSRSQYLVLSQKQNQLLADFLKANKIDLVAYANLSKITRRKIIKELQAKVYKYKSKSMKIKLVSGSGSSSGGGTGWKRVTPPFTSHTGYCSGENHFCDYSISHTHNRASGVVGNNIDFTAITDHEFESGHYGANTALGFWYKMPQAGMVEVIIKARPTYSNHFISLFNERGWSDAYVSQANYLFMKVNGSGPRYSQTHHLAVSDDSGRWNEAGVEHAKLYTAHIFSSGAYAKDQNVLVWVGTRNWNRFWSNDVGVWSSIKYRWVIEEVLVRAT